jgi:hypothetical protein
MKGTSVLATAVLAGVLVFGGLWAMDNTAVGLNIKCRVFNDLGACLIVALTEPASPVDSNGGWYEPAPTESSAERAAQEAVEAQAQRDAAVRQASAALGSAIDDLSNNAGELESGAADMAAAVARVADSVAEGMQEAYGALKDQTEVQPMDDFAQNDVCFALNDVTFARNDVEFALNDFGFAKDPYMTALEDRPGHVAAVKAAIADLNATVAANPDGIGTGSSTAPYTAEDGQDALAKTDLMAKAAEALAAKARADVAALLESADERVSEAIGLAAAVADC